MTTRRRAIASCAAAALAAAALAGLAGFVVLLVLLACIVCGLIILGAEAARPFKWSMTDGKAIRPARGAESQG